MLIDTSGFLCYRDRRDHRHKEAVRLYRNAGQRLTHSYVLAEIVPVFTSRGIPRARVLSFCFELIESPLIEVVWVTPELHRRALDLLNARADKSYSLCDAVSFILMRDRGIRDSLTTDHHFDQENLHRLLVSA